MTSDQGDPRVEDAPVEIFEAYFDARGWASERVSEGEVMASASGSWSQYELRAVWRSDDQVLQFLAFPDIKVVVDKKAQVYEAIGMINEQLWLGHFEYWSQPGIIAFRHAVLVDSSGQMSLEEAEAVAEAALEECERFYPVFQFVLWGGKSPSEAIQAALIDTAGEA
ncbi:YbjN domain-containing protein [Sphingomicrobium sediminis]|uniref:YbjN domain-containing protein n=1 Tax=Sphingomicrobium sediminis TaxID=2950949 RepID=A0A9X2EFQ8_9SPHN|nr:YbjN domain-containing protein [Sphingomicrobium sediminis]